MSRRLDEGGIPAAHGHLEDVESTSADPATRLEEYQYTPLKNNQIRILRLEPGDFGSPLSATFLYTRVSSLYPEPDTINGSSSSSAKMIKHRLEHLKPTLSAVRAKIPGLKHRYEAISYAWGPPDQPYHIIMHKHYRLPLTESLYSALQRFRHRRKSRKLWADATCINQLDMDEKSAQVAIMGSIYSLARRVLVWLGANENEVLEKLGCSLMRFVAEQHSPDLHIEKVAQHFESRQPTRGSSQPKLSSTDEPPSAFTEAGFGVRLTLESPWFTRLWTVQEICVARAVRFQRGTHSFSFSALQGFVSWYLHQFNAWLDSQDASFELEMMASMPPSLVSSVMDTVPISKRCPLSSMPKRPAGRSRYLPREEVQQTSRPVLLGGFIGAGKPLAVLRINSRSYLGFVPPATQVGDSVCMFYGVPFPFVVRERPTGGTYELLGDACFHGITDADGIGPDKEKTGKIILD